jgi:hypothetical protein
LKASKIASAAGLALAACAAHAAADPTTARSAPDAVSMQILAHHDVSFLEGATGPADVPAAIHRNFAKVIEQNLARMPASAMTAWLDGMNDAELRDLAQLYVNANADAHGKGAALQVFATRLDGRRLARLGRFFGYHEMNEAVLAVAPLKAQALAAGTSIVHAGPVPGAAIVRQASLNASLRAGAAANAGTSILDMSPYELYLDLRTMPIGARSVPAAIFETAMVWGAGLKGAYEGGQWVGTQIVGLMKAYAPDWYYGTFIHAVGDTVSFTQTVVDVSYDYYTTGRTADLGRYQGLTMPVMGVSRGDMYQMGLSGGDLGLEAPFENYIQNYPVCSGRWNEDCRPVQPW